MLGAFSHWSPDISSCVGIELTSHTSPEEEKILYLRKFAQNTRNYNEDPQLLEDTAD